MTQSIRTSLSPLSIKISRNRTAVSVGHRNRATSQQSISVGLKISSINILSPPSRRLNSRGGAGEAEGGPALVFGGMQMTTLAVSPHDCSTVPSLHVLECRMANLLNQGTALYSNHCSFLMPETI